MAAKRKARRKEQKPVHPVRRRFSELMAVEAERRSEIVKVLPRGVLPLVTSQLPQVSVVPEAGLVSAKPPITIPRYWGIMRSRAWGGTNIPVTRMIRALRPTEVGLFATLVTVVGAPMTIPTHIVNGLVKLSNNLRGQAEEDMVMSPENRIKDELLELKMRYELGEQTEDQYKIRETRLHRRLKDIRDGRETNITEKLPEKRKKKQPKRGKKKGKS